MGTAATGFAGGWVPTFAVDTAAPGVAAVVVLAGSVAVDGLASGRADLTGAAVAFTGTPVAFAGTVAVVGLAAETIFVMGVTILAVAVDVALAIGCLAALAGVVP